MGRSLRNITTLAMDLQLYCSSWGINARITETQRKLWPGGALPQAALGADGAGCLRLLKEDGHDGAPVGSCESARAARFFSSIEHVFPPERDLVRFGVFLRLGLFRTLHLLVKNRWEEFVLREERPRTGSHAPYAESLTSIEEGAFARLLDGFRLSLAGSGGTEAIRLLLEEHGELASALGLDRQRVSALVDQMVLARVHCCGAGSRELDSFEARQEKEIALLRDAGRGEEDAFWLKKSCWLTIQSELEDKLLLREDVRLRNFHVTTEWMGLFGTAYVELLEAQLRCHRLERRTAIMREEPSLGEEEIEARVKESIDEELASLEKVKGHALHAASLARLHEHEAETMSEAQWHRYVDDAKRIVREIWRLTHPDTLNAAFTERQRERLREYLEQAVKIRRSEAHLDVRAVSVLSEILEKVKELYGVMGIDVEPASVIRGDTLAEQTAWLEDEIGKIESQIRELMAEIQAMSMDRDVREKAASMADDEARKATLLGLRRLKSAFDERSVALQAEQRRMMDERRLWVAS